MNLKIKNEIDKKYDYVEDFYDGIARVRLDNKWGFINENGDTIVEVEYDYVGHYSNNLATVGLNGKYGYVDANGSVVIELKYCETRSFHNDFAKIKLNDEYGYVDTNGDEYFIRQKDNKIYKIKNNKKIAYLEYDENKLYKMFDKNMTYLGLQYKVGEIYKLDINNFELFKNSFYYYKDLINAFKYYPFINCRICEVEPLGEIFIDKIKIIKEIEWVNL